MAGEKNFENKIKKYLESMDIWTLKTFSNGVQRSGIPDLLICHNGRFIGMEVKAVGGTFVDAKQPENIRWINKCGGIAGVLIPTEGKERFRRHITRKYPDYIDTPIYDFDEFKQIIEELQ